MNDEFKVQGDINAHDCPLGRVKGKGERVATPIKYAPRYQAEKEEEY